MQKIKKEDLTNPNVKRRFVTYREASAMYGIAQLTVGSLFTSANFV